MSVGWILIFIDLGLWVGHSYGISSSSTLLYLFYLWVGILLVVIIELIYPADKRKRHPLNHVFSISLPQSFLLSLSFSFHGACFC
jgi:hypothetical protein